MTRILKRHSTRARNNCKAVANQTGIALAPGPSRRGPSFPHHRPHGSRRPGEATQSLQSSPPRLGPSMRGESNHRPRACCRPREATQRGFEFEKEISGRCNRIKLSVGYMGAYRRSRQRLLLPWIGASTAVKTSLLWLGNLALVAKTALSAAGGALSPIGIQINRRLGYVIRALCRWGRVGATESRQISATPSRWSGRKAAKIHSRRRGLPYRREQPVLGER
jgi:hypothetical protein